MRLSASKNGHYELRTTNKFGVPVSTLSGQTHCNLAIPPAKPAKTDKELAAIQRSVEEGDAHGLFQCLCGRMALMNYDQLRWLADEVGAFDRR